MTSLEEIKEAQKIVYRLRNPDLLKEVIRMMKISDPIGIICIKKLLEE